MKKIEESNNIINLKDKKQEKPLSRMQLHKALAKEMDQMEESEIED